MFNVVDIYGQVHTVYGVKGSDSLDIAAYFLIYRLGQWVWVRAIKFHPL